MKNRFISSISCLLCFYLMSITAMPALAMSNEERKAFLDAIRPQAAQRAGQAVRFKVDHLNQDGDWAVLVGSLLAEEGKQMDWHKAKDCEPELDKLLWVVAQHTPTGWRVQQMDICATEPPYWQLKPRTDFARPCGIYANLPTTTQDTAEQQCRAYQRQQRLGK
jgi:hypothetical protein